MRRKIAALFRICIVAPTLLLVGFVVFAAAIRDLRPDPSARADAIVVLTGAEERIAIGLDLLAERRARRLLISGVNPSHRTPAELLRRIGEAAPADHCCIDIGHTALNTIGNAEETRRWVTAHGFRSLIVVTSSYHLPRSIVEFSRVMPGIELVAHPVQPRYLSSLGSWRDWPATRMLMGEYIKLIVASVRLAGSRLLGQLEPVGAPPGRRPETAGI